MRLGRGTYVWLVVRVGYEPNDADVLHHGDEILERLPDKVLKSITEAVQQDLDEWLDVEGAINVEVEQHTEALLTRS